MLWAQTYPTESVEGLAHFKGDPGNTAALSATPRGAQPTCTAAPLVTGVHAARLWPFQADTREREGCGDSVCFRLSWLSLCSRAVGPRTFLSFVHFPLPWLCNGSWVHTKGELITNTCFCSQTHRQVRDRGFSDPFRTM